MKSKQSKSRKKGWKKVDITDVEESIADQRLQERTGGLVADKSNDELFFIDTPVAESDADGSQPASSASDNIILLRKSKREIKPLRSYANLLPDPRIPVLARQLKGHEKQNLIKASKPVTQKFVRSLQQRKETIKGKTSKRLANQQVHQEAYNLWGDDPNKDLDEHYAVVTKRRRVKIPSTLHNKPSGVPAVEAPHPGSSYNPAFDDHQELMQKVVVKQVKEDVEQSKLERRMKPNYGPEGPPTQETYLNEMSQGLGLNKDSDAESPSEDEDNFNITSAKQTATKSKMKTKKQKRKKKERLLEQAKKLREKKERMREDRNSNDRLRTIKKQVAKQEQKLQEKLEKKRVAKEGLVNKTKRLNKKKFEELEEDVLLTSELKGTLRLAKSRSTLLEDRFKSLQKRNIIEPRSRAKLRLRYKPKFAEKKPFKEITSKSRAGGGIIIPFHQRKHNEKE